MPERLLAARDWETPELVHAALDGGPGRRLLCPLGAGDLAQALSLGGAEVLASGPRPWQRSLFALKAAGVHLERLEHLQLLGLESAGRRVFLYHRVRGQLSREAREWWDGQEECIRVGVLRSGQVEQVLAELGRRVPLAHRRGTAQALLATRGAQRERFVARRWEGPRWRAWLALAVRELGALLGRRPPVGWVHDQLHALLIDGPHPNGLLETALLGAPLSAAGLPPCLHPDGHRGLGEAPPVTVLPHALTEAVEQGPFHGIYLGNLPVPDGVVAALHPGGRLVARVLPGDVLDRPGLRLLTAALAPERDRARVRGHLAVWERS